MYFSAHPNESLAWYGTPKIINELEFGIGNKVAYFSSQNVFIGGNAGFQKRIKPKILILGEVSGFYALDDGFIFQLSVGFTFQLK